MAAVQLRFKMTSAAPNDPVGAYKTANPSWVSTPVGSPTYESRPFGFLGDADSRVLVLNGSSQKLTLPSLNGLSFPSSTLGCWVRRNGNQPAFAQAIGWRGKNQLHIADDTGAEKVAYNFNASIDQYNWSDGPSIPDDEWTYVAISSRPADALGIAFRSAASTGPSESANVTVHTAFTAGTEVGGIGDDHPGGFGRWANGRFFEPALWIPALSTDELGVVAGGTEPTFNTKISVTVGAPDPDTGECLTSLNAISVNYYGATENGGFWEIYDQDDIVIMEEWGLLDSVNLPPGTYTARAQVATALGAYSLHNDPNSSVTFTVGPTGPPRRTNYLVANRLCNYKALT